MSQVSWVFWSPALWWGYFEGAKGAAVRVLSAGGHIRRYQLWLYSHLPLLMGITATAVGVKHVILRDVTDVLPLQEGWLLSLSVALIVLSQNAIFLAAFTGRTRQLHRFLIPHYVIALFGVVSGAMSRILPGIALLGILTFSALLRFASLCERCRLRMWIT